VNVFGAALPAIGVLSSLYVGVLEPCARPQSQLSAVVNFRGTILLFALVDPNLSYLTDTTTSGETSWGSCASTSPPLAVSRLLGTVLAHLVLVPGAPMIAAVARWLPG